MTTTLTRPSETLVRISARDKSLLSWIATITEILGGAILFLLASSGLGYYDDVSGPLAIVLVLSTVLFGLDALAALRDLALNDVEKYTWKFWLLTSALCVRVVVLNPIAIYIISLMVSSDSVKHESPTVLYTAVALRVLLTPLLKRLNRPITKAMVADKDQPTDSHFRLAVYAMVVASTLFAAIIYVSTFVVVPFTLATRYALCTAIVMIAVLIFFAFTRIYTTLSELRDL